MHKFIKLKRKDITQTVKFTFQKLQKVPKESQKPRGLWDKTVKFIVLDDQPLSVVENVGFHCTIEHLELQYSF